MDCGRFPVKLLEKLKQTSAPRKPPKPLWHIHFVDSSNYCSTISTRLFLALPTSVELLVTGETDPIPYGFS